MSDEATPDQVAEYYIDQIFNDLDVFVDFWRGDYEALSISRDFIHQHIEEVSKKHLRELRDADLELQEFALRSVKELPDAITDYMPDKKINKTHWWFWLDKLDELTDEERSTL